MKLLIDSSTIYLLIGLIDNDNNIKTYYRESKNDHSETIVDLLNQFLKNNNKTIDDITEIYVGRGPGSYTGERISGTIAKILSYLRNLPLYSFSSLDLISSYMLDNDGSYVSHIIAKKNSIYYKKIDVINHEILLGDELFGDLDILNNYQEQKILNMNDEFLLSLQISFMNIIKYKLYQEESNLDYVPNYLRSVV